MDPKLLLSSSPRPSSPFPLTLTLTHPHSRPHVTSKPHITFLSHPLPQTHLSFLSTQKTQFLPNPHIHPTLPPTNPRTLTPLTITAAAVKRRKEIPFDNVIQRDKKLKLVLKIRSILVNQPDRIMSLRELGRYRRDLGLTKKRRFIALLKRFPAVFDIVEEGVYSLKFRLTPEADHLYLEELHLRNQMEQDLVVKLRKLLMMTLEKRILLEKIAHLKGDLGLPSEFRSTICERYPQYFKVVRTDRGPALELTHWDPALAITAAELAAEERKIREVEERNLIIDRPPRFRRVKLPKGLNLSKGEMRRINMFNEMPYISPYSDFSELKSGSPEKEKHACAVVHEMLSLTLEKRTLVDHLTHFREEFRFSQQVRGMLIRHPDMFYVSLKGDRDSVFLREAYRDSKLIEKDQLLVVKEKMRELVAVPRLRRFPANAGEAGEGGEVMVEGSGEEDVEDWSDVDDFLGDAADGESDDDDGGGEDDWSDEEDELPLTFDDGKSLSWDGTREKTSNASRTNEEKDRVPVLPDGRPRERW